MTKEDIKTITDIVHKTIYGFFDVCEDEEETPMTDKDKLLLKVNKAICTNIKALEQDPCEDAISRQAVQDYIAKYLSQYLYDDVREAVEIIDEYIGDLPPVNPQEPKTGWNNHQIACMLADLFGDACACNYNGIDEWLSELCDFKDTCCPNPVGVACWEQFLKYSQSRYTECGYEVRDKNALKEPKTGHWIDDNGIYAWCSCCKEHIYQTGEFKYCPNCGARMEESGEA